MKTDWNKESDSEVRNRRSIRLKDYDYSQEGLYFVTMCTHGHIQLFGRVKEGVMHLSPIGLAVEEEWMRLHERFPYIVCHEHVVMPNHFHGVIQITSDVSSASAIRCKLQAMLSDNKSVGAGFARPNTCEIQMVGERTSPLQRKTLGQILAYFKYQTTKQANLPERLWQRNYYEHVIRNQHSYEEIAEYIRSNPYRWESDKYHKI